MVADEEVEAMARFLLAMGVVGAVGGLVLPLVAFHMTVEDRLKQRNKLTKKA